MSGRLADVVLIFHHLMNVAISILMADVCPARVIRCRSTSGVRLRIRPGTNVTMVSVYGTWKTVAWPVVCVTSAIW